MYKYLSMNPQCTLGSSYPIDFPQCQLYKEETKVEQVTNEGSINVNTELINELLNDGKVLEDQPIISVSLKTPTDTDPITFNLTSAVESSGAKLFYDYNKKSESQVKKIKIISMPDNGIILYNKPMVRVANQNGWSNLLYTLTGVPYFQVADKMDYIKVIARENDIIDLVMAKNVTMEPLRTDEKVEGTLKFSPIGVWEGSGQEVEVQIS